MGEPVAWRSKHSPHYVETNPAVAKLMDDPTPLYEHPPDPRVRALLGAATKVAFSPSIVRPTGSNADADEEIRCLRVALAAFQQGEEG